MPESAEAAYAQTIPGVEIFRTGVWNGDRYTLRDLQDILKAAGEVGYRPPVKLGHQAQGSDPAYGWVENLRIEEDKLLADFANVPDELVTAIKDGRYGSVSSEIFFDLARNGKTHRRALKAVAVLGADVPGVSDLKPLADSVAAFGEAASIHLCTKREDSMSDDATKKLAEAEAKVAKLQAEAEAARKQAEAEAAKVAELSQQVKEMQAKGGDDSAVQIRQLQEQLKELSQKAEKAEEERRLSQIDQLVGKLKIPALRDHVRALADLATSVPTTKTVVFAVTDDKGNKVDKPTKPMAVVEDLIARLNRQADRLFHEVSPAGNFRRETDAADPNDDPGEQVHSLAQAYATQHKVDYATAQRAVLGDPDNAALKRRYAAVN